jgi:hypothetical protein
VAPPDELDLSDWLDGGGGDDDDGPYDMYVLGFQEVVPLRARNVLGADKKRVGMRWIELTRAALNRSSSSHAQRGGGSGVGSGSGSGDGGGRQKVHPLRDGGGGGLACRDYRCVVSKQMVGVLLTVWVRSDLRRFVRRASVSCVGCGVMGCLGNKVRSNNTWSSEMVVAAAGCAGKKQLTKRWNNGRVPCPSGSGCMKRASASCAVTSRRAGATATRRTATPTPRRSSPGRPSRGAKRSTCPCRTRF